MAFVGAISADLNHQIILLISVQELEAKLCSHCCVTVGWHNVAVYGLPPDLSFSFLPARCYASAGNSDHNVSVRPSVCPVRHAPVLCQKEES